jgi:cytochrome c553
MPLRARAKPPVLPSVVDTTVKGEGTFLLQDVYASRPPLPPGTIQRLRIVQVLPKSTPHANEPTVGIPNGSPGKQVLGTVPVEADGSAYFRAPAGIPLALQALDEHGQAVQIMRSVTYLQPGEMAGCIGCHEPRSAAPPASRVPRAALRPPSTIAPGPDGSKPLSYPILVQPVLDRKCVACHSRDKPEGKVVLTGEPEGRYSVSYNALAPRVPYSAWEGNSGPFVFSNGEPTTLPDRFGARGCKLMRQLVEGHQGVVLSPEEIERLATWMDANALFYGTFDPADQARQQRGERIPGPKLE